MATIYDVPVNDVLKRTAEDLKSIAETKPPEWAKFAKTGVFKERSPIYPDWWYMRCAAILRSVRVLGPVGTSKLRTKYGGRKNRGHKPDKFFRGSGNIIRKALQQLEAAGLIRKAEKRKHKGRIITDKGIALLDKNAVAIYNELKQKQKTVKKIEQKEITTKPKKTEEKAEPEKKVTEPKKTEEKKSEKK